MIVWYLSHYMITMYSANGGTPPNYTNEYAMLLTRSSNTLIEKYDFYLKRGVSNEYGTINIVPFSPIWGVPGIEYRATEKPDCTGKDLYGNTAYYCAANTADTGYISHHIFHKTQHGTVSKAGCQYHASPAQNSHDLPYSYASCPRCKVPPNANGFPRAPTYALFQNSGNAISSCGNAYCDVPLCTQDDYDADQYGRHLTIGIRSATTASNILSNTIAALTSITAFKSYLDTIL